MSWEAVVGYTIAQSGAAAAWRTCFMVVICRRTGELIYLLARRYTHNYSVSRREGSRTCNYVTRISLDTKDFAFLDFKDVKILKLNIKHEKF